MYVCMSNLQYNRHPAYSRLLCAFVLLASEPCQTLVGSEDLSAFLMEQGVPTAYLHSGIKPMQRLELLRQLRSGEIDVIVGVNLLREVRTKCLAAQLQFRGRKLSLALVPACKVSPDFRFYFWTPVSSRHR